MSGKKTNGGWRIGYSIPIELMCVLELLFSRELRFFNPPDFDSLRRGITDDWQEAWIEMFPMKAGRAEPFKLLADWSGNMFSEDYSKATLDMRSLTLEQVAEMLVPQLKEASADKLREGIHGEILKKSEQALEMLDLKKGPGDRIGRVLRAGVENTFELLQGGALHGKFWHLLDRFWFEFYKPWRERQLNRLEERYREVEQRLGCAENDGEVPDIDWLPPQNPLRFHPPVRDLVIKGKKKVCFWVEPFGLFDMLLTWNDWLLVPFGDPSGTFKEATKLADDLATRCKALGDPTRVLILRMIRDFSFDNTTMANYLGLARPTVSVHCKILREAGFIETEIVGRQARHRLKGEVARELLDELDRFLELRDLPSDTGA